MRVNLRTILLCLAAILVLAYLCVSITSARAHSSKEPFRTDIQITDSAKRQQVTSAELYAWLQHAGLTSDGCLRTDIRTDSVERVIKKHPMIRTAQCHKTQQGVAVIRVTQRIPLLHIQTETENYFVDTDRKIMPYRPDVTTDVLLAGGHIGPRTACGEAADFALWLQDNRYWRKRITRLHLRRPKDAVLIQADDEPDIVLGDINGYEEKLHKLRVWYEKGQDIMHWSGYRELDVRFDKQVVARRKD